MTKTNKIVKYLVVSIFALVLSFAVIMFATQKAQANDGGQSKEANWISCQWDAEHAKLSFEGDSFCLCALEPSDMQKAYEMLGTYGATKDDVKEITLYNVNYITGGTICNFQNLEEVISYGCGHHSNIFCWESIVHNPNLKHVRADNIDIGASSSFLKDNNSLSCVDFQFTDSYENEYKSITLDSVPVLISAPDHTPGNVCKVNAKLFNDKDMQSLIQSKSFSYENCKHMRTGNYTYKWVPSDSNCDTEKQLSSKKHDASEDQKQSNRIDFDYDKDNHELTIDGDSFFPSTFDKGDVIKMDNCLRENGVDRSAVRKIEITRVNYFEAHIEDFDNLNELIIEACASTNTHLEGKKENDIIRNNKSLRYITIGKFNTDYNGVVDFSNGLPVLQSIKINYVRNTSDMHNLRDINWVKHHIRVPSKEPNIVYPVEVHATCTWDPERDPEYLVDYAFDSYVSNDTHKTYFFWYDLHSKKE